MKMTKVSHWVTQHRFSRGVAWSLFSAILLTGTTYAFLTDNGIHAPPTSGTFAYNTFKPGAAGFPAVGGIYIDPVFGGVVRRLSNRNAPGNDDMYAHYFANANGTYAFQNSGSVGRVISTTTGAVLWSAAQVPRGSVSSEMIFDTVDPDKYYYFNGNNLMRRNLMAQTDTTMRIGGFPGPLASSGGSVNTQSADGRYFTLNWGGTNKVWDSLTNTIYSGSVTRAGGGGWVGITPDGKYLVTASGDTAEPNQEHYSYAIDHVTKTIAASPRQFWGLSGDHAVLVSASDGKSYYIGFNSFDETPGLYRVDITLNQVGKTTLQQLVSNLRLVNLGYFDSGGHFCGVSRGPFRDWVFVTTENGSDTYNSGVAGWTAWKSEILAVNVLTSEVRRLAHHRSRGLDDGSYWNQPRTSCSSDGSVVLWNSNFNIGGPGSGTTPTGAGGYADLYAIQSPLGAISGPIPAPQNLRFK